jgi:probable rRNA maturation factor
MSALQITFSIPSLRARSHVAYLRKNLQVAHRLLKSPLQQLSIAMISDKRMIALHKRFMGIAKTTDVLSFAQESDQRGRCVEGEIAICIPQAARSAKKMRVHLKDELLLYALHGLLHLSGFDDRTERDYHIMHRREDAILRRLGVGPIFWKERP